MALSPALSYKIIYYELIVIYFIITIPQLFITLFAHIYLFIFILAL